MGLNTLVRIFLAVAAATAQVSASADKVSFGPSTEASAQHGALIFNSIYDSLRKWGSSIHPNGMSLFLATVPEGVLFHHGNGKNATPTSLDWLAYEIEHAEMFARPSFGPREQTGGQLDNDHTPDFGDDALQLTLNDDERSQGHGWLHTYRTTRPLQFLYLDGMSGDKGDTGVVDTQDYLLRAASHLTNDVATTTTTSASKLATTRPPGPPGEYQRAIDLCNICKEWELQGIIRTEGAGTEIIKCDFFDGLEEVQSVQRSDSSGRHGPGGPGGGPGGRPGKGGPGGRPGGGPGGGPGGPHWGRTPTDGPETPELGFRDIGSGRTLLDYSALVSAFFFPIDLTNPDSENPQLPRLVNAKTEELIAIKNYFSKVLEEQRHSQLSPFTWRDIADLVVRRYSSALSSLVAASNNDYTDMAGRVQSLLNVFEDYSIAEPGERYAAAQERCIAFYIQSKPLITEIDHLIYAAFKAVNTRICETLLGISQNLLSKADSEDSKTTLVAQAKTDLKDLVVYLNWSVFNRTITSPVM